MPQLDVEVRGDVSSGWDFVGAGAPRQQLAVSTPDQFFGGDPAQTLHKTALDLSDVQRRVERMPHIMQDVHAQQFVLTRQRINRHLAAGSAIRKVVERTTTQGGTVVVDVGRGVKTIAPELHPLAVGVLHRLREGTHLLGCVYLSLREHHLVRLASISLGQTRGQVVAHLQGSAFGGSAVQIGAAGGCRGAGIGDFVGVGAADAHLVQGQAQHLGHHGTDLGVQALAHLGAAVVDQHTAIGVDRHQGTRLVELGGGEADAEFHWGDSDTALDDGVVCVEAADVLTAISVVAICRQLGHEARQYVVFHSHGVGRGVARCLSIQVSQSHIQGIELQAAGHVAHHGFYQQHALRPAKPTKRGVALGVEFDAVRDDIHRF